MSSAGKVLSRRWPALCVVAASILLAAFFTPKRPVGDCVSVAHLGAGATLSINCDSRYIARDAKDLDRYLTAESAFRSRPVHIVGLGLIAHVLSPVLVPAAAVASRVVPQIQPELMVYYLAGIVFNAAILALATAGLLWLLDAKEPMFAMALAGLVASLDVTVAWFWVPHQILMNVLAPVGGVAAYILGRQCNGFSVRGVGGVALAAAAACLAYGYCLVWPPAFEIGLAVSFLRTGEFRSHAARAIVFALLFCLPLVVWFGAFALQGSQVSYEAQGVGQFQWIGRSLAAGTLLAETKSHLLEVLTVAAATAGYFCLPLAIIIPGLVGTAAWRGTLRAVIGDRCLQGAMLALALMVMFNFLQGYHQGRLLAFPQLLMTICALRLTGHAGLAQYRTGLALGLLALQLARMALLVPASAE